VRREPTYSDWPACHRTGRAFTLIELLVALALSVLVLQLVLPLLSTAKRGAVGHVSVNPKVETWRSVIQADLSSLVSQAKCGVATARIDGSRQSSAFERLELQTLSRPGDIGAGPIEARYVVEPVGIGRGLGLVRYGQGWHDGLRTRHVLLHNLSGWEVRTTSRGDASAKTRPASQPSGSAGSVGDVLAVTLRRADGSEDRALFWVGATIEVTK